MTRVTGRIEGFGEPEACQRKVSSLPVNFLPDPPSSPPTSWEASSASLSLDLGFLVQSQNEILLLGPRDFSAQPQKKSLTLTAYCSSLRLWCSNRCSHPTAQPLCYKNLRR